MLSNIKQLFKTAENTQLRQYIQTNEHLEPLEKEALKKAEIVAFELERQLEKDEAKYSTFCMNFGEGVVVELEKSNPKNIIYIKHYERVAGQIIM